MILLAPFSLLTLLPHPRSGVHSPSRNRGILYSMQENLYMSLKKDSSMQRKIIMFICAIVAVAVILSAVSVIQSRSEYSIRESKLEPTVKYFIEVFNNVDQPEYKTKYWDLLSQQSKDKLIEKTGSEDAAQREVWIMLQEVVDVHRQVEYLGIEHMEIQGDMATVFVHVKITEEGQEPVETTVMHRYRWENGEWKFIDWYIEPELYKG